MADRMYVCDGCYAGPRKGLAGGEPGGLCFATGRSTCHDWRAVKGPESDEAMRDVARWLRTRASMFDHGMTRDATGYSVAIELYAQADIIDEHANHERHSRATPGINCPIVSDE